LFVFAKCCSQLSTTSSISQQRTVGVRDEAVGAVEHRLARRKVHATLGADDHRARVGQPRRLVVLVCMRASFFFFFFFFFFLYCFALFLSKREFSFRVCVENNLGRFNVLFARNDNSVSFDSKHTVSMIAPNVIQFFSTATTTVATTTTTTTAPLSVPTTPPSPISELTSPTTVNLTTFEPGFFWAIPFSFVCLFVYASFADVS
jgi:hypothetical protein